MTENIASQLIRIAFHHHEAQIGYLNKDNTTLISNLQSAAELSKKLAEEIDKENNLSSIASAQSTIESQTTTPATPVTQTVQQKSKPKPFIHPGFLDFAKNNSNGWIEVESTNIKAISYDQRSEILSVHFLNDSLYEYFDVPQVVFKALLIAPSKGKFFHENIRNTYDWQRVG